MQDWRGWRGNHGDAVEELVTCLKSEKVKRLDIVLEVVSKLREGKWETVLGTNTLYRYSVPDARQLKHLDLVHSFKLYL